MQQRDYAILSIQVFRPAQNPNIPVIPLHAACQAKQDPFPTMGLWSVTGVGGVQLIHHVVHQAQKKRVRSSIAAIIYMTWGIRIMRVRISQQSFAKLSEAPYHLRIQATLRRLMTFLGLVWAFYGSLSLPREIYNPSMSVCYPGFGVVLAQIPSHQRELGPHVLKVTV